MSLYTQEERAHSFALDRSIYLLKQLTNLGKNKCEKYYGDYRKVEILLYLWECLHMYVHGFDILRPSISQCKIPITMQEGKLHIGEIFVTLIARYGFDEIKDIGYVIEEQGEIKYYEPAASTPPFLQKEIIDIILNIFGLFNTNQLIKIFENTYGYKENLKKKQDVIEIDDDLLIATGEQIYDLVISNAEIKDINYIITSFRESYQKIKAVSKDASVKKRELAKIPNSAYFIS